MPKVSKLWKLKFDMQYNFINGSYKEFKESKKAFAKEAVENYHLLKYVNNPIEIRGNAGLLSKVGRNMIKNILLDKLRIKTPEERKFIELAKKDKRTDDMHRLLGIK